MNEVLLRSRLQEESRPTLAYVCREYAAGGTVQVSGRQVGQPNQCCIAGPRIPGIETGLTVCLTTGWMDGDGDGLRQSTRVGYGGLYPPSPPILSGNAPDLVGPEAGLAPESRQVH